jgi:hypothetical protein
MRQLAALAIAAVCASGALADCLPIEKAPEAAGKTACIRGTVVKAAPTRNGSFHLDFCADYRTCPFTVFVPAASLRNVGDVRELQGKEIEIEGKVQRYAGHAEIVLKELRQLRGEAARIPPLPKDFDVSRRGNFSAGTFSTPKTSTTYQRGTKTILSTIEIPD